MSLPKTPAGKVLRVALSPEVPPDAAGQLGNLDRQRRQLLDRRRRDVGVVPRTLWSQVIAPDDQNRVRCGGHCLLARDGRHTVLVDTGYGGKYDLLDRRFYAMEQGEPLLASLAALKVAPEEIDTVVFSHLHFDHAGGATRYDRPAARAHLPQGPPRDRPLGMGRRPARAAGLQTAYNADNLLPLEQAGLVDLVDGNCEVLPGLRTRITGGTPAATW